MMALESAIAATRFVEAGGGAVEVVDLRTLAPFDEEAIAASVSESGRAIVVTEEPDFTSFARHIHSWISQNLFWKLDTAPALVTAIAAPSAPYSGSEEAGFFPTAKDVERALADATKK